MQEWFRHDFFAPEDAKLMALQRARGYDGIGIYWTLMAVIGRTEERAWLRSNLPDLAFALRLSSEQLESDVATMLGFGLLCEKDGWIFSHGMQVRMQELDEQREKARRGGIASGKSRRNEPSGSKLTTSNGFATHSERVRSDYMNDVEQEE